MSSDALGKTVITDNWQIFSRKLFQHLIHHKKYGKSQNFNLKPFAVQEFSTKIYPCGTLYSAPIADMVKTEKRYNTCLLTSAALE